MYNGILCTILMNDDILCTFNKYIIFLLTQLHAFNGCSWKVQMINDQ